MTVLVCCLSNKCCLLTNTILLSFYNPPFQHKTSHAVHVCASNLYILEPNKGMYSSSRFHSVDTRKNKKRHIETATKVVLPVLAMIVYKMILRLLLRDLLDVYDLDEYIIFS